MESQESNISREQNSESPQGLVFSKKAKHDLNQARKWAKFLAVLYFVLTGFLVIAVISAIGEASRYRGYGYGSYSSFYVIILLLATTAVFLPALFLNNFSNQARDAAEYNDEKRLEASMKHLFSYANTRGIITIIGIVLVVFSFLSGAAGGLF